jgi:hypothetical protein
LLIKVFNLSLKAFFLQLASGLKNAISDARIVVCEESQSGVQQ